MRHEGVGMRAGLRLGALGFLAGLVLGPVRELLLAPRIGGLPAALAEAAAMVAALWWLAGLALRPPPTRPWRTGLVAVVLVVVAELLLGAAFDATGLAARRAPRGVAEQAIGLVPLAWLGALPRLRRQAA